MYNQHVFIALQKLWNKVYPCMIYKIHSCNMQAWAVHVAHIREMRNVYKILVGKPKGKRPLGRHRHKWEDNIKTDLGQTGLEGVD
jgi:hypothetical protein